MPVPFIDLRRFEPGFMDRWIEICRRITENTMFVSGPEGAALEKRLAELSGAKAVVGCANGTDAIQLALRAAGVGEGDVVLIPDATFWATFEAVVNVGARPVTVDISLDDLQMDFDLFREGVERFKPRAAILVHLYGWGSRHIDQFRAFCRERDLPLIEDTAQGHGVTWKGASIFRDAYMASCSYYPAKVLGSCGDAGSVYCSTAELADTVRKLGNHGRTSHYGHGLVGWNSRLGGFDAAWLNLCLDYDEARLASRRKSAEWLRAQCDALGVRTVAPPEGYVENGYLNVTMHDPEARPRIEAVLKERGIGFGNVYPGAMSKQPGAAAYLAGTIGGEKSDLLSRSVLNLPLFAHMREEELDEVMDAMKAALAAV
ncbi:MAG: aminotransferase class I/II-fold pyridoxal phosphate-dependent enzyme [Candidatus Sumerlaeia bacterium]|nr:aminotransferase class I/II-fold pyridoxal phosphate-dependent enzyme [Candidatus Sumerlaeia bacterium]